MFSVSFLDEGEDSKVSPLAGPVPPSEIEVREPETPGLWRAQVEEVWSMPKPEGPGRSIKLVVASRDFPGDVLGWLELASAPLVMGERDARYPVSGPNHRVDLRTVGAHPEFAAWRGSSLVGMLGMTDAVLSLWERRYGDRPEIVQTTGAFGISAVYERKRLPSGRRWRRVQLTSGTYPLLTPALYDAAREVMGATHTRHPVDENGRLVDGRDNMRRKLLREALLETGHSSEDVRTIVASMGIQRALYVCDVRQPTSIDPDEEVREAYSHWRTRYMKEPER